LIFVAKAGGGQSGIWQQAPFRSAAARRRFFTHWLVSAYSFTATSCGEGKRRRVAALQKVAPHILLFLNNPA